jgi:uncharacterized protein with von Willebrand factor type A (vWA) domain
MEERLLDFAALLRRNGIRVSTAETLDALRAATLSGLRDRVRFKSALRATMVKRAPDVPAFNSLFDAYFSGIGDMVEEIGAESSGGMSGEEMQNLIDRLARMMEQMDPPPSDLARALATQDTAALERMLSELGGDTPGTASPPDSPTSVPAAVRRMMDRLGAGSLADEMDQLVEMLRQSGASEQEIEQLREYLERRLKDLGKMLKRMAEMEGQRHERPEERDKERERLLDKSFYYLSATEIKQMREAVSALARRLRNLMSIRRKHVKRGRLDVKKTIRGSLEFGGVPFRIRYEDKRKERPQVVILCDVSDSVRNVSRFMLQFVHSLQDMYSRVRSYVFVADIAEVTKLFSDNDIQTAIHESINGNVVNVYAHSDFGRAFKDFHAAHLDVIDSRTTVIILGDARNNYNVANEWVLRDVQERAKQVIWLNPENRSTWGFGDSEMGRYAPFCDVVEECRNLRQLYRVVDRMVLA